MRETTKILQKKNTIMVLYWVEAERMNLLRLYIKKPREIILQISLNVSCCSWYWTARLHRHEAYLAQGYQLSLPRQDQPAQTTHAPRGEINSCRVGRKHLFPLFGSFVWVVAFVFLFVFWCGKHLLCQVSGYRVLMLVRPKGSRFTYSKHVQLRVWAQGCPRRLVVLESMKGWDTFKIRSHVWLILYKWCVKWH